MTSIWVMRSSIKVVTFQIAGASIEFTFKILWLTMWYFSIKLVTIVICSWIYMMFIAMICVTVIIWMMPTSSMVIVSSMFSLMLMLSSLSILSFRNWVIIIIIGITIRFRGSLSSIWELSFRHMLFGGYSFFFLRMIFSKMMLLFERLSLGIIFGFRLFRFLVCNDRIIQVFNPILIFREFI